MENLKPESPLEGQPPHPAGMEWKRFVLDLFETIGLAVVLFLIINTLSARVRVDGFSMLPTLHDGEFVLVSRVSYRMNLPQRGDIIVFRSTTTRDLDLIKRIIGLPADQVAIRDGKVFVNDQPLQEPYTAAAPNYSGQWTVPADTLFVLGDNRNDSSDSHAWGFLPEANLIGKAILIYWPPKDWTMINHYEMSVSAAQ